jgi:transcriptional regulator with XRE-family HTH domain
MNIHLLRIYGLENRITIKQMANELRISQTHLHNILSYKRMPSSKLALKIEEYTNHQIKAVDLLYPKDNSGK